MADATASWLGHVFAHPGLYQRALTHRSFGSDHNERLEFVGDAVLNCVVGRYLFDRFPDLDEGALSRMRASLVNRETLAEVARSIGLGTLVRLGEGEQRSGGPDRPSILADGLEALIGAVFVDAGYEAARGIIERAWGELLLEADPLALGKDPKTRLQEWLQGHGMPVPLYRISGIAGEAHAQTFVAECAIPGLAVTATGEGSSRRAAEQAAARAAWPLALRAFAASGARE